MRNVNKVVKLSLQIKSDIESRDTKILKILLLERLGFESFDSSSKLYNVWQTGHVLDFLMEIHCKRHFICTNLLVPEHEHGDINLLSFSSDSKQILH